MKKKEKKEGVVNTHMTFKAVGQELNKNKMLYAMMIPTIIWVLVFSYIPMGGIVIAFKKFNLVDGIIGSPWAGLYNFDFLFNYKGVKQIFFNTIWLNVLFLVFNTVASVFLALMFVEIGNKKFKKITQSIAILPYFVSWAVVSMFLTGFLGSKGIINQTLISMGKEAIPFYSNPGPWRGILVILKIWQGAGFGTVIYIATITGMDPGIYEAAKIDGANRFQLISKITLPLLKPTIILLSIMGIGGIFRGDFGMIYALIQDNSILYPKVDVIDTFVYRALRQLNNMGMSSATSLFQSVVGFVIVLVTNTIAKKVEPDSALF